MIRIEPLKNGYMIVVGEGGIQSGDHRGRISRVVREVGGDAGAGGFR
jgi:hypothetical protein